MSNLMRITKDNFATEVVAAAVPVLIDFGADWCAPCKKLAPIVEDLAKRYSGRLKVGYVDVGKDQALAADYKVMSVPTLLFFKGGKVVRQLTGFRPADELETALEEVLG